MAPSWETHLAITLCPQITQKKTQLLPLKPYSLPYSRLNFFRTKINAILWKYFILLPLYPCTFHYKITGWLFGSRKLQLLTRWYCPLAPPSSLCTGTAPTGCEWGSSHWLWTPSNRQQKEFKGLMTVLYLEFAILVNQTEPTESPKIEKGLIISFLITHKGEFFFFSSVAVKSLRTCTANTSGSDDMTVKLHTGSLLHLQCYLTTLLFQYIQSECKQTIHYY